MLNLPKSYKQTNNYSLFINWYTCEVFLNTFMYLFFYISWTSLRCFFKLPFLGHNVTLWTEAMCFVNWPYKKRCNHINTNRMCIFKLPFWEKLWSQLNVTFEWLLSFMNFWAFSVVKLPILEKLWSHFKGFFTSCTSEIYFLKACFWEQLCLHKWHQIFSSLHESQQCVSLNWPSQKNCGHKYHIWMIC